MAPTRTDSSSFDDERKNSGPSSEMPFQKPPTTDERFPIWHRPDGRENSGPDFQMAIKECPVTEQRLPFWQETTSEVGLPIGRHRSERLRQAGLCITILCGWGRFTDIMEWIGVARATIAASYESPQGTTKDNYAERHKHLTVLQQHVAFFDADSDGVIYPRDTYNGFRRLGWTPLLAVGTTLLINTVFSYPTLPPGQWFPDFKFRIYTDRIHKDKHGNNSGIFDHEGRFIPQHFEEIFSKYAGRDKQDITKGEIFEYVKSQKNVLDVVGWAAAFLEWSATWHLLSPKDGKMKKDDIRRIYDGSLFYEIAARNEKKSK
ncbi:putative caleosin domain-containing protein [Botrytis cinerea BcDW1]|uniref:Putative caleosin domain-containing protein n=1 Tax=Botryotinia fuckeliana (strain BcDW1) TaxID=1290391 RepID=M7U8K1_BOTF1|nr:putative caleosin domain-containing protein [Botrytis cinerea BcDW1]